MVDCSIVKPSAFLAVLLLLPASGIAAEAPTARQIVERIQKNVGVAWRSETIDTFKAGDPDTRVTGIATTFIASIDVLERAVKSNKNFIITHEPTFYNHNEKTEDIAGDPVLAAKQAFIEKHHLVVFRFHDHWHMHRPDGIMMGMNRTLGWQQYLVPPHDNLYHVPEMTVAQLAAQVRDRLKIRTLRVVGDPQMKVTKVAFLPGSSGSVGHIKAMESDQVEAVMIGETTEWQAAEYARDAVKAGKHKAFLLLGHVMSEEAGMEECARWLKGFVPEVPIEFIPAGEPFWAPK